MMKKIILMATTIGSQILVLSARGATDDFTALIVSAESSFVESEAQLNYATEDAERVARAMRQAGRLNPSQIFHLKNPTTVEFNRAVKKISKTSAKKFMFYYSGHSNESGLHLKDGRIDKSKFHELMKLVSSKVKIVILDSCFSGALKTKGIKKSKPIELVQYDVDEPTGSVVLTSSSDKEFSYESEKLKGSIFTYHLVSGLYGQADGNSDGLVTIDELYQYVYSQTKYQSMVSGGVVQRPEFDSKLSGQGALVVSFPARINGRILLAENLHGDLTLASTNGVTFFKFFKNKGESRSISLPYGTYNMSMAEELRVGSGKIELMMDEELNLSVSDFAWTQQDKPVVAKKGSIADERPNDFLFGFMGGGHPGFEKDAREGNMGDLFILSPSAIALSGRWKLALQMGAQTYERTSLASKVEYNRLLIGTEASYRGIESWNNDWLLAISVGTLSPKKSSAGIEGASLFRLSIGARFYPRFVPLKLGVHLGFEGASADGVKKGDVSTLNFSIAY